MFTIVSEFTDQSTSKMEHMDHEDLLAIVETVDNLPNLRCMTITRES
jgi:hypothetical protein